MQYKFCPKCGGGLKEVLKEHRQELGCSRCGFVFYQNAKTTVTAMFIKDGSVLITKRKFEPRKGAWNLPGGFLEADEHPFDGLRREMQEELGVEIEIGEFLGFFMDKYNFAEIEHDTINLAWVCTIKSGEPKAGDDAEAIKWFPINDPQKDFSFKCDHEMLEALKKYLTTHDL